MNPLAETIGPLDPPDPIDQASDTIGQLMVFWGFKHIMGRIWAILYLSPKPLTAPELVEKIHASSGSISMGLRDLLAWGAIHKVCPSGSRKDHFVAEGDIWKMVSRVLSEREGRKIEMVLDHLEQIIFSLQNQSNHSKDSIETQFQLERLNELRKLGRIGKQLLNLLLIRSKIDLTPLQDFLRPSKNVLEQEIE